MTKKINDVQTAQTNMRDVYGFKPATPQQLLKRFRGEDPTLTNKELKKVKSHLITLAFRAVPNSPIQLGLRKEIDSLSHIKITE